MTTKQDLVKLKAFEQKRKLETNDKLAYRMGENICIYFLDIYIDAISIQLQFNIKPVEKWTDVPRQTFFKKDIHMAKGT